MRPILAILTVLLPLVVAAPASALIQVDKGIAGARLGNTKAEVRAALGRPAAITNGTNDFGPFTTYRYRGGVLVNFQGRTSVTSVSTGGRGDRTARGVGVGSRESTVRRRVRGVRCETVAGFRSCHTHKFRAGQVVTDFLIKRGKVTRVTVGRVLD
jgi:hypothetical protein